MRIQIAINHSFFFIKTVDSIIQSGIIEHIVYGEGRDDKIKSTYDSNINVIPDVDYYMQIEVLRNDLGDNGDRVSKITIDGVDIGDCNPDGGDYDCTFFDCQDSLEYQIVSSTNGSISVSFTYEGHSWDCDCDKETWICSKESTISGRTPMTAVARITLIPYLPGNLDGTNLYFKVIYLIDKICGNNMLILFRQIGF